METTFKIDVNDYITEQEIKEIVQEQIRYEVRQFFKDEKNAQRLLSNLSYQIVFNEIDKIVPESKEIIINKTKELINDVKSYSVFRDRSYGNSPSLAYQIMEEAVKNNKDLLNEKVKDTIINKDYSSEIWDKFEELSETFMSNIYSIVELGRKKSNQ